MLKYENPNKATNTPKSSIPDSSVLTKKNNSFLKEIKIEINNKDAVIKKNYTNQIFDGTTSIDDSKSKNSSYRIKKKPKKSHSVKKNKKKEMNKYLKLLIKNKKLKIPTVKSNNVNIYPKSNSKKNNKIEKNIIESLPKKSARLDSYGNIIVKGNKKKVHIRFSDNIPKNNLIDIIPIESFKKYNIITEIPESQNNNNSNKCCQIF